MVDIANAFSRGVASGQALRENRRRSLAYNALRGLYGDMAGDPVSALQLQSYGQNEQSFPLEQENRRLTNEHNAATLPYAGPQAEATLESTQLGNREDEAALQRSAALNGLLMLRAAAQNGGPEGAAAAFDRIAPVLPQLGVAPEQMQPFRDAVVQDPTILDGMIQAIQTAGQATSGIPAELQTFNALTSSLSPEEIDRARRVELGLEPRAGVNQIELIGNVPHIVDRQSGRLIPLSDLQTEVTGEEEVRRGGARGQAVGTVEGETAAEDLPMSQSEAVRFRERFDASDTTLAQAERQLQRVIEDADGWSVGLMSATGFIPGTPAANMSARLKSTIGNVINREVAELKRLSANGSSGYGQLTELEAERIAAQYAALDQSQSPSQFIEEATELLRVLQASRARMRRAMEEELSIRAPDGAPAGSNVPPADENIDGLIQQLLEAGVPESEIQQLIQESQ